MQSISSVFIPKIENHVSVSIHFDHVLKFRIGHHADCFRKCVGKFQGQTHVTLSHETEVIVLAQISGQVECVQGVSVSVIFAANVESLVPELLSGAGKQTFVSSYIQSVCIVRLYITTQIAAARRDTARSRSSCSV